jgi:hypothetical protein
MNSRDNLSLVLNSAQGKYPIGNDPWVQSSAAAVMSLAGGGGCLIGSTRMNTWELATWLAGRHGVPVLLILPAEDDDEGRRLFDTALTDLDLFPDTTEPLFIGGSVPGRPKAAWSQRDAEAVKLADVIYPVSIRSGGKLETLLRSMDSETIEIDGTYRVKWRKSLYHPHYDIEERQINPDLGDRLEGFLTHWTRSCAGPWPGEKPSEFYRDLIDNPDCYVRDAEWTIARIIWEETLRGSSENMPGGEKAVPFTELPPARTVPLMRWRQRYVRYSFEPYGLAIRRTILTRMGARKVSYRVQSGSKAPAPADRLFVQPPGETGEWTAEAEWRCRGDLSLKNVDPADMSIIAVDRTAAQRLRQRIERDIDILPLFL